MGSGLNSRTDPESGSGLNKRRTGYDYEAMAADFLIKSGFKVIERNYRCRAGEIDIIAVEGRYLVFVEVKYRSGRAAGCSLEAIDSRKAAQVRRIAAHYLMERHYPDGAPCRFDAVGIDGGEITHIRNAF